MAGTWQRVGSAYSADISSPAGKDPADPGPFRVHLSADTARKRVDVRFINHDLTPDQARSLGVYLIEAAARAEGDL